jgi:hypothetical protein
MNIIKPQTGQVFTIKKGESIKIIDIEGEQVADFWAFNSDNENEFLSAGVSIDCNSKLLISTGDKLYSNLYNPLFQIVEDTTGIHALIYPCCRQEMYDYSYGSKGKRHPSCLQNMNDGLQSVGKKVLKEIHPFNIFMNTKIQDNGKITVQKPITKAGDYIILQSLLEDLTILITSCSVDSGNCNGGNCSSIGVEIINKEV